MVSMDPSCALEAVACLQWNLQRSRAATEEVLRNKVGKVFALIQEPYTGTTGLVRGTVGMKIYQMGSASQVAKAAVVVFDPTISGTLLTSESDSRNIFVEFKFADRRIIMASCYSEPDGDLRSLGGRVARFVGVNMILAGDLNARSVWWGDCRTNARGLDVCDMISAANLHVLNVGVAPTFEVFRAGRWCRSRVDVTFCSSDVIDKIEDWSVEEDKCDLSDHKPINFKIGGGRFLRSSSSTRKYDTQNADWGTFDMAYERECLSRDISCENFHIVEDVSELENMIDRWMSAVGASCDESMRRIRAGVFRAKNKWWTEELAGMKRSIRRLARRLRSAPDWLVRDVVLPEYLRAKDDYKEEIRKSKIRSWKEFCGEQGGDTVWRAIHRVLCKARSSTVPSTLKVNGVIADSGRATAVAVLDHFFPPSQFSSLQNRFDPLGGALSGDDPSFVAGELGESVRRFNPARSPGGDGFDARVVKRAYSAAPDLFLGACNACLRLGCFPRPWKGSEIVVINKPGKEDLCDVKSYRPIGLLSVFGKALERLMCSRISWFLHSKKLLHAGQFGFTPQRSAEDALMAVVKTIKAGRDGGSVTVLISLDIKGAFDNAEWSVVMGSLARLGIPANLYNLVSNYFKDRSVSLNVGGNVSTKQVGRGCIQGSVCGPLFWNVLIDGLLKEEWSHGVSVTAFADDVAMVVVGPDVGTVRRLANASLSRAFAWGDRVGLTFSTEKTQVINLTRSRATGPALSVRGVALEYSTHLKMLGVVIDDRLNWSRHVDHACRKAVAVVNSLCRAVKPTWGLSSDMVRLLYTGAVSSIALYASNVWCDALLRKCNMTKLERLQRPLCLRVCRSYRTVSTVAAQVLSALPPLWLKAKERADLHRVRSARVLQELPSDRKLQTAVQFGDLLHPAHRVYVPMEERMNESKPILNVYTAGSQGSSGTGSAFVIVRDDRVLVTRKFLLANYCSKQQASLFSVWKSLEWLYKWLVKSVSENGDVIKVDVRMEGVRGMMYGTSYDCVIFKSQCLARKILIEMNKRVEFVCEGRTCGAYAGLADDAATAACRLKSAPAYDMFTIGYAKERIRLLTNERWNDYYKDSVHASGLKDFFEDVGSALKFVRQCGWSYHLTQALTGHGCFRAYLNRFCLIADPSCMCDGVSVQSVSHLLFDCELLNGDREVWKRMCERFKIEFSMNGIRKAIQIGEGLKVIGECLKDMVESTISMNEEFE